MRRNMIYKFAKYVIIAALMLLSGFAFNKTSVYAEELPDIGVSDVEYVMSNGYGSLRYAMSINNTNISALVIQIVDSDGHTVYIETKKAERTWGYLTFYIDDIVLDDGIYTLFVSDYNGIYKPAEAGFKVEKKFECTASLSLYSDVTLNFNMFIPNRYRKVVIDGQEFDLVDGTEIHREGYAFYCRDYYGYKQVFYSKAVPAKEYDDRVDVFLYELNETPIIGDSSKAMVSYSVRDYLKEKLDKPYDYEYELCRAINNYGYAASDLFEYNVPSEEYTVDETFDLSRCIPTFEGECPPGLEYFGSSLLLDSTVTIRHYFVGDSTGLVASVNNYVYGTYDERVQVHKGNGYCYVDITNILPQNFNLPYELVVWTPQASANGAGGFKIQGYSVLAYCNKVISDSRSDKKLVNMAKAIANYAKRTADIYPLH